MADEAFTCRLHTLVDLREDYNARKLRMRVAGDGWVEDVDTLRDSQLGVRMSPQEHLVSRIEPLPSAVVGTSLCDS